MNDYKQLHDELRSFHDLYPEEFSLLYRNNQTCTLNERLMKYQLKFNLLEIINRQVKSSYRIYSYQSCFFITDYKTNSLDQVFSPYDEEVNICAPFYTNELFKNQRVLEIGTGCGLYTTLAAEKDCTVTGVDINPKAVEYAKFNILLNNVQQYAKVMAADIESMLPLVPEYDLVIASLPYMPNPPTLSEKKTYSDGGEYGWKLSLQAISQISKRLNSRARLKMYTMNLGNEHTSYIELNPYFFFNDLPVSVTLTKICANMHIFSDWYTHKFSNNNNQAVILQWLDHLKARNLNYMHYVTLEITPASKFSLTVKRKDYNLNIAYPRSKNIYSPIV
ncbi:methyltransferase domain-containing protein [Zooshikella ganghwensis]|nr:methyltransferase domain-containing protein [Zooshikella ganghwensis]